ncbi:hypothetical protein H8Z76_02840 [Roseburia sp. BX0805]|uniref:Uncharacterized protein n=1 Tax=Roseburia yibonii TaxID=2763063 RepID=A0ABR7I7S5_9FIRM|nr:hypothetical protein [Roseburia yibonii]MBC5752969.1 hypothetical protein [Roseburia yibonii]
MKKNFFPIIITALLFFPGCGTSNSTVPQNLDSSETYASEDNIDISQSNTEDSTESNVISYYDTVIRCDYDTSLLKPITITSDSDFQSLSVFASSTSDNSSEILNAGDCVYAGIVDVTKDDTFDFYFHPEDFTESFFTDLFDLEQTSSYDIRCVSGYTYELWSKKSDLVSKGKILYAQDNSVYFCVYKVSSLSDRAHIDAFNHLYDSISFVASEPKYIKQGDLFDRVSAICPNATIYSLNDTLNIQIPISHSSYDEDCTQFFNSMLSICDSCELEDEVYKNVGFSMFVDNKSITYIVLLDYSSPSSFSTCEPTIVDKNYAIPFSELYNKYFYENDIGTQSQKKYDALDRQYGFKSSY